MRIQIALAALIVSFAFLSGCYPVKAYKLGTPVVSLSHGIALGYVEFDDNGELFSRNEFDSVIQKLIQLQKSPVGVNGVNVVVFIHGWKNNASDQSGNVPGFQYFLNEVYKDYAQGEPQAPVAPLMGIYIGWRGASLHVAKDLTYWNRSLASTRVSGPHLEEVLQRIILAVRGNSQQNASTLVIIGHSFGGRVLEHAMTPYLQTNLLMNKNRLDSGCGVAPGLGSLGSCMPDLTVLLNEAAPATDAKQFLDYLKVHAVSYTSTHSFVRDLPQTEKIDVQPKRFPLLLSVTSEGDFATGVFLPIGQFLARSQLKTRKYCADDPDPNCKPDPPTIPNQSTYFTHSTAHIPALYSHRIARVSCASSNASGCQAPPPSCASNERPVTHWRDNNAAYTLCEIENAWNQTPYWVASLPVSIVPDHTNIFRSQFVEFIKAFLPDREVLRAPKASRLAPVRTLQSQ